MDIRQDWFTPISNWDSPSFVNFDCGLSAPLRFTIQNGGLDTESYQFEWDFFCAFQTVRDGLRYPWNLTPGDLYKSGASNIITESSWIAHIQKESGLLDHHYPNCRHYAIYTSSFWIEVISNQEPKITKNDVR